MKLIPLSQGKFAKVDDADFEFLSQFKWAAAKDGAGKLFYALSYKRIKGKRTSVKMHRVILGVTDPNIDIDHKDGDGLNNQRHNIRIASKNQNAANRKGISKRSKYKGVEGQIINNKTYWRARCMSKGVSITLKAISERDAALKYNELALKHHGEFAFLNDVE